MLPAEIPMLQIQQLVPRRSSYYAGQCRLQNGSGRWQISDGKKFKQGAYHEGYEKWQWQIKEKAQ